MSLSLFIINILLNIYISQAAIFMWSNKKLEISPLQPFTKEQFSNLTRELDNPQVFYFRSRSDVSPGIKNVIDGYYSAYLPNGDLNFKESIDLIGSGTDAKIVQESLSQINNISNILSVISIPNKQFKREIEKDITESPTETAENPKLKGPVIYTMKNKNETALLYSSKPLLLKINDTDFSELHLGNTQRDDQLIFDGRRINIRVVPFEISSMIALRFDVTWVHGYWSISTVRVEDVKNNRFNLTTEEDITAPAHFSYHCNGQTVFSDGNGVELYIYDIQVQVDSKNGKFGDVNDCVSFTTAPIWSGLFVTTLLGIGLIVALTAIMDIKTMDKFDNYKTKNLTITISE